MARLAECPPSSDDELPDLNTLLHKTSKRTTKSAKPATKAPVKHLVPKSTSKSSARRVRRLAEPSQALDNPLFQRWNSEDHDHSRGSLEVKPKEPRVKVRELQERAPRIAPSCQQKSECQCEDEDDGEDKDDKPRRLVRGTQRKQPQSMENSGQDSDEASDSGTEALLTRIRKLQSARTTTTAPSQAKVGGRILQGSNAQDMSESKKTAKESNEAVADDPSIYQTAEEDSSGCSEDSTSVFNLDNSPKSLKTSPAKTLFNPPQRLTRTSDSASVITTAPSLWPNDSNIKSKGAIRAGKIHDSSKQGLIGKNATIPSPDTSSSYPQNSLPSRSQAKSTAVDLADTLSKLRLQLEEFSEDEKTPKPDRFTTPPSTPPKTTKLRGLASPSKRIQIPKTPHRPSMDSFWSQDVVNDWNDQYSPRKLILPPVTKSPTKPSPKKETKKAFAARRHALSESFLRELDSEITQGRIAELAKPTGGVKIVWTKTLNTTAGRANWRRETVRTKKADGTQVSVTYKHHASIELAEKVIDDEHRLLNVLAHEFCHLANFMVSGVTTNPHGKEFKAWAARCSLAFGDRGIQVTTKHSYDIDFKYVWECSACGTEFKRHSKSIDPQRHRCGSCKSELKQTKPVPRGGGGKTSKYQEFVKEQMSIVREENPGSPQKEMMRLIAGKWSKQGVVQGSKKSVDDIVNQMVDLTLDG